MTNSKDKFKNAQRAKPQVLSFIGWHKGIVYEIFFTGNLDNSEDKFFQLKDTDSSKRTLN